MLASFTFQSGSIQMKVWQALHRHLQAPLHSNLVLFKSEAVPAKGSGYGLYIPIWFYSNYFALASIWNLPHFTFQSGSIQIITSLRMLYCS